MKRLVPLWPVFALCAGVLHAGPEENVIVAAMRLSDAPNYSWVATVSDDARTYDIKGRTSKEGFTHVKMPVVNAVRRRLGRGVTDTEIDVIFRGSVECVFETEHGWRTLDELPRDDGVRASRSGSGGPLRAPVTTPASAGVMKAGGSRGRRPAEDRHYSNLQLGVSHPHEELGIIVSSHHELRVEGEVASGSLTPLGAQLLLVRDGQQEITPLQAAGTFKLWLRDGVVTRYQVTLRGTLEIETAGARRLVEVQQTTVTVIKDVGTTQVAVPDEARQKLLRS